MITNGTRRCNRGEILLRRRVEFSAGHAYWLPELSEPRNRELFGRWASPWGHGHNYRVEVGVAGRVDESTGMVVNIVAIDGVLKQVVGTMADKHLNHEVEWFRGRVPTLETIAEIVVREFRAAYASQIGRLAWVRLDESPTLWLEWTGTGGGEMLLTRRFDFAAAHRLHAPGLASAENLSIFGKCNNPHGHGHNYGVEVTVSGVPDPVTGMLVNLAELDAVLEREVTDRYDHKHLNLDTEDFRETNPTSENLTLAIWRHLEHAIPAPARLHRVVVEETDRNRFEYYGEEENENAPAS